MDRNGNRMNDLKGLTIGVLMGTGRDGGGVGMLQHEYVKWAKRNGIRMITWFHKNKWSPNWRASSELAEEGERREYNPLTCPDDVFSIDGKALDALLVFKPPQPVADEDVNKAQAEATMRELKWAHEHGTRIMMYHFDYSAGSVEKRLFYQHPEMLDYIDVFWANNGHNALFKKMMARDPQRGEELMRKTVYRCHQVISDADQCRKTWLPVEDKALRQFYYQSRPNSWKGYVEVLSLKKELHDAGIDVNVTLNGLNPGYDVKSHLYVDPKASVKNRKIIDGVAYDPRAGKNAPDKSFHSEILPDTMVYGAYDHVDGLKLMRQAGFGVYFTRLETWNLFFPENATFDIVKSGTVALFPAWYYDHSLYPYKTTHEGIDLIDARPEDVGGLAWLPGDTASTEALVENVKRLESDHALYDDYRSRMLDWMSSRYSADTVLTDVVSVLMGAEPSSDDGVFSDNEINQIKAQTKKVKPRNAKNKKTGLLDLLAANTVE